MCGEPRPCCRRRTAHRVYPRVCGGTHKRELIPTKGTGLSPRVRGNPCGGHAKMVHIGSIPACAGEPPAIGRSSHIRWVYPRVCGGTKRTDPDEMEGWGLSPRVRGNLRGFMSSVFPEGSIPACAGEPSSTISWRAVERVYPRVCGGTIGGDGSNLNVRGLSPRVRGNPLKSWRS